MKRILIVLEDPEYESLNQVKGNLTWKQVLLSFLEKDPKKLLLSLLEKDSKKKKESGD